VQLVEVQNPTVERVITEERIVEVPVEKYVEVPIEKVVEVEVGCNAALQSEIGNSLLARISLLLMMHLLLGTCETPLILSPPPVSPFSSPASHHMMPVRPMGRY